MLASAHGEEPAGAPVDAAMYDFQGRNSNGGLDKRGNAPSESADAEM